MHDGPRLVRRKASILAYALQILRRDPGCRRSASSGAPGEFRAGPASPPEEVSEQRHAVDAAVVAYVEWRAACTDVGNAYARWARSAAAAAEAAYLAYRAALDREQAAADVYAGLMKKVGHLIESGLDYPLSATFWPAEPR